VREKKEVLREKEELKKLFDGLLEFWMSDGMVMIPATIDKEEVELAHDCGRRNVDLASEMFVRDIHWLFHWSRGNILTRLFR